MAESILIPMYIKTVILPKSGINKPITGNQIGFNKLSRFGLVNIWKIEVKMEKPLILSLMPTIP